MNKRLGLLLLLFVSLLVACKKEKAGKEAEAKEAKITTIALASTVSTSVYGSEITFKVKFEGLGTGNKAVDQYGIFFIESIATQSDKIPAFGNSAIILIHDTPVTGVVIEKNVTLTYAQFNDANYRAFARLKDGAYVLGEVLYFVKA